MSILNWFKGTGKKKQFTPPISLVLPWRRGALGEIYCSYTCYKNAGNGMLVSHGKSKPCCFCQSVVTYGQPGVVYMPFLTEPNLVCAKCHGKAHQWNATQKECSLCGKAYANPAEPATASTNTLRCRACSTEINDWHYDFESIVIAPRLGSQCSGCGRVLCKEHSVGQCNDCGSETVMLMEGPANSSMVTNAKHLSKYNRFIRDPNESNRAVIQ